MTFVDWNYEADRTIRPGSIELQRVVHKDWFEKIRTRPREGWMKSKPFWRVKTIEKLEVRLGRPIAGEVLEIGAGTALCSAFAAQREAVTRVTAMDYDQFCVEEMMPAVFEKFDAPATKIRRALGSYNNIPDRDFYDIVIGVGALHHAENLGLAFSAVYSCLKPGGVFLVSDVCEYDHVTNHALHERYESIGPTSEGRYGRPVRLKDNGDHWYRFSEWLSAARGAGFEALPYLFDAANGEAADDGIFASPALWRGFQIRVFQPYFSDRGHCDSLLMIAQKPMADGSTPAIPNDVKAEGEIVGSVSLSAAAVGDAKRGAFARLEQDNALLRERADQLKQALGRAEAKLRETRTATGGGLRSILRRILR